MTTPDPSTARVAEALRRLAKLYERNEFWLPTMNSHDFADALWFLAAELDPTGTEKGE